MPPECGRINKTVQSTSCNLEGVCFSCLGGVLKQQNRADMEAEGEWS